MAAATRVLRRSVSSEVSGSVKAAPCQRSRSSGSSLVPIGLQQKANSDSNLVHHFLCHRSSLTVDREKYVLGSGHKVTLSWDIQEDVTSSDWIGLFLVGERDPNKNIDYRSRGENGTSKGEISWFLDQVDYDFTEAVTKVCFRYYHGGTVDLLASSDTIAITKRPEPVQGASSPDTVDGQDQTSTRQLYYLTVSNISAHCLKKGMFFNPDPYVKLSIQPGNRASLSRLGHHGQHVKTSIQPNTTNPDWATDREFPFKVLHTDSVEFVVKDKFAKSRPTISRFLGKLSVPGQKIVDSTQTGSSTLTYNLMRRNPSDNVSGYLVFTVDVCRNASSEQTAAHIKRRNAVKVKHPPDVASPMMSPLRSRRRLEQSHAAERSPDEQDRREYEDANVSLSALTRGRLHDSLICDDMLSCSPPCIGVVPSIECVMYDEVGIPHQQTGVAIECPAPSGESPAELTPDDRTVESVSGAVESDRDLLQLGRGESEAAHSALWEVPSEPPPLPPKTKLRSLRKNIPGASIVSVKEGSLRMRNCDSGDISGRMSRDVIAPATESLRRGRVQSGSVSSTASSSSATEAESQVDEAVPSASPSTSYNDESVTDSDAASTSDAATSRTLPQRPVSPPSSRVLSLSDQLARIPSIESAISPDIAVSSESFLFSVACRNGASLCKTPGTMGIAEPATAQLVVTSRLVSQRSSSPVVTDTPQRCVAVMPQSPRLDSVSDSIQDTPPGTLFCMTQTDGESETRTASESSIDGISTDQPPVLPPRRLRHDYSPSRGGDRLHHHSPSTPPPPPPSVRERVVQPDIAPRPDSSPAPELPPRNVVVTSPPSPTLSTLVPVQRPPSSLQDTAAAGGSHDTSVDSVTVSSTMPPTVSAAPRTLSSQASNTHLPAIAENGQVPFQVMDTQSADGPLPRGWEARVDSHGRVFYIDHMNRTTTWRKPQFAVQSPQRVPSISTEDRQQMDRRYQSIRRTMSEMEAETEDVPDGPAEVTIPTAARSLMKMPAVKFITRPDIFTLIQENDTAVMEYNQNSTLKHMINKIRRDPQVFDRYQHNRDLVTFLNHFVDTAKELPRGWEMKYDRSAKPFFIDHNSKKTTFIDPRLPIEPPLTRSRALIGQLTRQRSQSLDDDSRSSRGSAGGRSDNRRTHTTTVPVAYNEKVVAFLRQPTLVDILKEKNDVFRVTSSLWAKLKMIRNDGTEALVRLSNDVELIILLSLFENEILSFVPTSVAGSGNISPQDSPHNSPALQRANLHVPAPYKRDFQAKLRTFRRKMEARAYGQGPGKFKLVVRRDHVLEDAFNKIMSASRRELQRNKLYIAFNGEEGLDYGGPSREFFFLLSRELFNPYYGLFEYSANDTYTVQISPMSTFVENAHQWFRFAGRVIALALVHQYLLDAFFTRPFYKFLLRLQPSLNDLESLDAEFHQSLLWIKDNDITDLDLGLTFSVDEEVFGQVTERELKTNGKNIAVTEKNKKDYIGKMVTWRLDRGVSEQRESVIRGFYEVMDVRLVSIFDAKELELVTAGTVEIDVAEWRKYTEYRAGYHDHHQVVQWFWMAVERYDNERRLRLLQFVTGTSSIPYEGFSALRGSNGPRKFCIEKWGKINSLPRSHTCFNRLDLPPYTSFEMLFEKLTIAVEETSTFGIE